MSDAGNDNGERIDEPLVNSAVVGVTYDDPGSAAAGGVTVDGLTATLTVTGGDPDERRDVDWGDGTVEEYVLSDAGDQVASHTYEVADTYTVTVADTAGNVLTSAAVTVADPPAPDPEAFDPDAHTVADVVAYLAEHSDDADRVLDVERAGRARTGIIGGS